MEIKRHLIILIAVLAILLAVAVAATVLHDGEEFQPKNNASLVVTGDVMFARKMPGVLNDDPFRNVENVTASADALLINFENAATNSGNAVKGDVPLKTSPDYVHYAKNNNVTVASLANNHAFDYGISGMHDTRQALKDNGIIPIGAGDNADEAHSPVNLDLNGRNVTILNFMDSNNFAEYSNEVMPVANDTAPGYSAYDSKVAGELIKQARENGSDMIVVYFHYGNEYSRSPNEDQIAMSHEVIDAGADVVLGSHPHVTQGIEVYNGKPIFYSLGNFIFDQSNPATHSAYFVEIDMVNDTGICTVYPVDIVGYIPQFMSPESGKGLLAQLNPQCEQLNITDEGVGKLQFNLTYGESSG